MTNIANNTCYNGILPYQEKSKSVTVNGKTYDVKTVQDHNPLKKTFAPTYKEVVVIDGKQYDVKQAPDILHSNKNKDVVIINGKSYSVDQDSITPIIRRLAHEASSNNKIKYEA